MYKNISKQKLFLAFISLLITFFVWQQGLRESLSRPSVSFDISQKEQEIAELASQSVPTKWKKYFIPNDPIKAINTSLSSFSFDELTERNKIIWMISSDLNGFDNHKKLTHNFQDKNYALLVKEINKKSTEKSYKPDYYLFDLFKNDRFLYHLLSKILTSMKIQ